MAKQTDIIEIRVRRFFTSDEGDATPMSVVLVTPTGEPPDWASLIESMTARTTMDTLREAPFTNLRPMTEEEVESYRMDEEAE